jgi:hypothetical protein
MISTGQDKIENSISGMDMKPRANISESGPGQAESEKEIS